MFVERKEIIAWAKINLVNKHITVFRAELNGYIGFSNSGIKEAINQPHKHYDEKNKAIRNIVELLKNAQYVKYAEDVKARCFGFYYFKTTINDFDSFIVVKKNYDNTLRFYSIVDNLR